MEAPEPEGVQPDGHTLPPETNYRAANVIGHWVGKLGRAYIEDGTAAKLYEAGYTSIQDMDFDPEELMDLGFSKPRATRLGIPGENPTPTVRVFNNPTGLGQRLSIS